MFQKSSKRWRSLEEWKAKGQELEIPLDFCGEGRMSESLREASV